MKKIITKKEIIPIFLILSMFAVALGFYFSPCLPDKLPTHWNSSGEIDGYGSKNFVLFFFPLLTLGMYLLMTLLPLIDPLRENYKKFQTSYFFIKTTLVIFFSALYYYTFLSALGYVSNINLFIIPFMSLFFIVLGLCLPKIKRNFFVGIRTPWTLKDDKVWEKTHQLGGKTFVIAGVLSFFSVFLSFAFPVFLVLILLAAFIPFFYSYFLYRRMGLFQKGGN